jgi:hypothetical protein
MSDNRPKRETIALEEATVSNMWEIAAIVEELERKGFRQEIPRRVIRHPRKRGAQRLLSTQTRSPRPTASRGGGLHRSAYVPVVNGPAVATH